MLCKNCFQEIGYIVYGDGCCSKGCSEVREEFLKGAPLVEQTKEQFSTGSQRDSRKDKGRFDLLPPRALKELAKHFEIGAKMYGERNWEKGMPLSRYLDSALRHTFQHLQGLTNEPHDVAAVWNLMCLIETKQLIEEGKLQKELDDLPKQNEL